MSANCTGTRAFTSYELCRRVPTAGRPRYDRLDSFASVKEAMEDAFARHVPGVYGVFGREGRQRLRLLSFRCR